MAVKLGIYKCKVCGNIAQILVDGEGELVCCGEEMELLEPKYEENEIGEKHVPEIEVSHEGCESGVCTELMYATLRKHPMTEEHYIQFIEAYDKDKNELRLKFFKPEENAVYDITGMTGSLTVLELCNLHGLWRNKKQG